MSKDTQKILFLENVAGIAGDMFSASFVDAGLVRPEELQNLIGVLGLNGVRLVFSKVTKALMQVTHLNVEIQNDSWKSVLLHGPAHAHDSAAMPTRFIAAQTQGNLITPHMANTHWHTHYSDIDRLLANSKLDSNVKDFSRKVFRAIAEVEASAHGMLIDEIAFHEVGAIDSILDVVCAAYCVTKVGLTRVLATPIKLGRGVVNIEHGTHPVPPPATAKLVVGMPVAQVPLAITRENVELSTPTGVAILKVLAPEFVDGMPSGKVVAQGMGGGTMDLGSYPNVFRVALLESVASLELPYFQDEVMEISCNIDDETPERMAWLTEQLLEQGALEVWQTHVTAKKSRAAIVLSLLSKTSDFQKHAQWLMQHSTTFGLRYRKWDRLKLEPIFEERTLGNGARVVFKQGLNTQGRIVKEKPEFDSLKRTW